MFAIDPTTAQGFLNDVDPLWRSFWFHMHLMARNLTEFATGLDEISEDVYDYHVSGHKNEIARWVQEVIGDAELSRALTDVPNHGEAARLVRERISELRVIASGTSSIVSGKH